MRYDWRAGVLYFCFLAVESCCLYLLLALLNTRTVNGVLSVSGLLLLYPAAFAANKALQYLRWHRFWLACVSWILWAIATVVVIKLQLYPDMAFSNTDWLLAFPRAFGQILVTFRPEILIFLVAVLLWWLGRRMAYVRTVFITAIVEFQLGLIAMVLIFLIASMPGPEIQGAVPVVLLFFLFALSGISLSHSMEGKTWLSGLTQQHWSVILIVSIGVVLILGLVIGSFVTPELLHSVVAVLKRGWDVVWGIIMKILLFLASLFPPPDVSTKLPPELSLPAMPPPKEEKLFEIPELLMTALRIFWTVLMSGLILVALWSIVMQMVNYFRRRFAGMDGVEVKGLRGAFRADILNLLKYIWMALYGLLKGNRRQGANSTENSETAVVRGLYRRLLHWAARYGYPRQRSQTPQEFLDIISGSLPDTRMDLVFITDRYVNVRYGNTLPSRDELEQLNQSWLKVKKSRLRAPEKTTDNQEAMKNE